MKKFKYALWALLIALLGLMIYQNQGVFLASYSVDINLGFAKYHIPKIYNVVLIALFFFAGLLTAYAVSLLERFRARKQIRSLKQTVDAYGGTIATLNREVDALKPESKSVSDPQDVVAEPVEPSEKTESAQA